MKPVLWFVGGFIVTINGGAGLTGVVPGQIHAVTTTSPVAEAADQDPGQIRPPARVLQLQIEEAMRAAEEAMRTVDLEELRLHAEMMFEEIDLQEMQEMALEQAELEMLFSEHDLFDEMDLMLEELEFDELRLQEMKHAIQEFELMAPDLHVEFDDLHLQEMEHAMQ